MNKIILVVSQLGQYGGTEKVVCMMANYWAHKGRKITILTYEKNLQKSFFELDDCIDQIPLRGTQVSANLLEGIWNNLKRILKLRKTIQKLEGDVILSYGETTNIIVLLATIGLGAPVIVSDRSNSSFYMKGLWRVLHFATYLWSSRIVVQSMSAFNALPRYLKRNSSIIPNPIADSPASGGIFREKERLDIIMAMGRLVYEKGFDLLIRAFSVIERKYPHWELLIYGDGPFRNGLEKLICELSMSKRIQLLGVAKDALNLMQKAKLFVLPSRHEGFPNVLCEAMQCGLPVISFDCNHGPREMIEHGVNGLLVPREDIQALSEAISWLIDNEHERKRMAIKGIEMTQRYRIENVMNLWEKIFEAVGSDRMKSENKTNHARDLKS